MFNRFITFVAIIISMLATATHLQGQELHAQVGPPPPMVPNLPSRHFPDRGQQAGGISVNGVGQSSGPADIAHITLQLGTRNGQATLNTQTLQPVVDALIAAHADPKSIVLPMYLGGAGSAAQTNYASVSAAIDHPTLEMLQSGMVTIAQAFNAMPNIVVQQAQVAVSIRDCGALRSRARGLALLQAHAQAADIARQTGVSLGKVQSVSAFGDYGGGGGPPYTSPLGCTSYFQLGPNGYQPSSLSDLLQVHVTSNVSVTYAIR